MSVTCKYCKKTLATKYILKTHQEQTQYCKKLRKLQNIPTCQGCGKKCSSNLTLLTHKAKCVPYTRYEVTKQTKEYYDGLLAKILEGRDIQYKLMLEEKENFYRRQLKEKDGYIIRLQNKLESCAIKTMFADTRANKDLLNLIPVTNQLLLQNSQYLTIEHIKLGGYGYVKYAIEYPFNNKVVCTNYSLKRIKYKNAKNEIVTDVRMVKLGRKFFSSIKERNWTLTEQYIHKLKQDLALIPSDGIESKEKICKLICQLLSQAEEIENIISGIVSGPLYSDFVDRICSLLNK